MEITKQWHVRCHVYLRNEWNFKQKDNRTSLLFDLMYKDHFAHFMSREGKMQSNS